MTASKVETVVAVKAGWWWCLRTFAVSAFLKLESSATRSQSVSILLPLWCLMMWYMIISSWLFGTLGSVEAIAGVVAAACFCCIGTARHRTQG